MRFIIILAALVPMVTHAESVQEIIYSTLYFIHYILIPFILGIAFFVFVVNAVRFFIIGGTTDDGQENGKKLVIYSVLAFVFILSFWGLVNIFVSGLWGSGSDINPDCHFKISDYVVGDTEPCYEDPYGLGPS